MDVFRTELGDYIRRRHTVVCAVNSLGSRSSSEEEQEVMACSALFRIGGLGTSQRRCAPARAHTVSTGAHRTGVHRRAVLEPCAGGRPCGGSAEGLSQRGLASPGVRR